MTPKRPTLPEGTDPVAALRQLQRQLAEARYMPLGKNGHRPEARAADQGARDAERAAGMNLAPIVDGVETLVGVLRQRLQEMDPFGPDASEPAWYGSVWACPVAECKWTHREENAVSSTDTTAAERVHGSLVDHLLSEHGPHSLAHALVTRMLDWPAHCSEWVAGVDPENPDQCPEYASPGSDKCALHDPHAPVAVSLPGGGWTWEQRLNLIHGGHPDATPTDQEDHVLQQLTAPVRSATCPDGITCTHGCVFACQRNTVANPNPNPRLVLPPAPGYAWRFGFGGKDGTTVWKCQSCGRLHEPNPPRCLGCGHTVLDPGHWVTPPAADQDGR